MPKRWNVRESSHLEDVLPEVVARLSAGGVIAYPTDTLYGLAAHPWNPTAVRRLFEIKGRDAGQAIPLIAADQAQVEASLGTLGPMGRRLASRFWPGALTLVVRAPDSLPALLLAGGRTVAVRVPAHPVACALATALGVPITATSANRSGEPPTADPDEVMNRLGDELDGVVDAGRSAGGPPSTIVDVIDETPRLVRAGAVPWERVVQFVA